MSTAAITPSEPERDASAGSVGGIDLTEFDHALRAIRRSPDSARFHDRVVKLTGIDIDQSGFALLLQIDRAVHLRLTDLAHLERLDLSVISRKVKQLEDAGYVERAPAPEDRRATIVRLSETGRTGMQRLHEKRLQFLRTIFESWDPADVEQLGGLLTRFVAGAAAIMEQKDQ